MTLATVRPAGDLVRPALLAGGLFAAVAARWAAVGWGANDGIAVGLMFGTALAAVALAGGQPLGLAGGQRLGLPRPWSALIGVAGGAILVGLAVAIRQSGPGLLFAPSAAFLPWVSATILVGTAEELILRGVLFDALDRSAGLLAAVVVTSILFALMHVPLYGWHVVPLDLGVGFWLGGLRLVSGGVAAPAIAHVLADLATWWL
jgi:membrane protease YdiL (CAAX protease family)